MQDSYKIHQNTKVYKSHTRFMTLVYHSVNLKGPFSYKVGLAIQVIPGSTKGLGANKAPSNWQRSKGLTTASKSPFKAKKPKNQGQSLTLTLITMLRKREMKGSTQMTHNIIVQLAYNVCPT